LVAGLAVAVAPVEQKSGHRLFTRVVGHAPGSINELFSWPYPLTRMASSEDRLDWIQRRVCGVGRDHHGKESRAVR
jgi:hypothetical protein